MNKFTKYIILAAFLVIVFLASYFIRGMFTKSDDKKTNIQVLKWDKVNEYMDMISTNTSDYSLVSNNTYKFHTNDSDFDNNVKESKYYVGDKTFNICGAEVTGQLLFKDNQYLLINKTKDTYYSYSCASMFEYNNELLTFPSPAILSISKTDNELAADGGYSLLDLFFSKKTFEDFKEFYSLLPSSLVSIDEENQLIKVKAYNTVKEDYISNDLVIDCKGKDIYVK